MYKLLLFILFSINFLLAETITITHQKDGLRLHSNPRGKYNVEYADIQNLSHLDTDYGSPDVPVYVYRVILEHGQTVNHWQIQHIDKEMLDGTYAVQTKRPQWRQDKDVEAPPKTARPKTENGLYPSKVVQFLGIKHFKGRPIAHFAVSPV
ncbi:MAG: hypothetical protein GF313_12870, partial [Caldithrix sp.]|nr:hypothetical protein [Caldithrix sp.]